MTIQDPARDILEHVEASDVENTQSVLDEIRRNAQDLRKGKILDLPIPGYHGKLVARYKRLPYTQLKRTGQRIDQARTSSKGDQGEVDALATQLVDVNLLVEVCAKTEGGKLLRLDSDDPVPFRFDPRLAEWAGIEVKPDEPHIEVLYKILGKEPGVAVLAMADTWIAWSRGVDADAKESLLGE